MAAGYHPAAKNKKGASDACAMSQAAGKTSFS
jgi:hypothetical protein